MYPINKDAKHEALAGALAEVLADQYVMYHVAHGFHWNVVGSDFAEYHEFFSNIYEDVFGSVDPTAENIRKLGFDAPYLLEDFLSLTSVKVSRVAANDPQTMLMDLARINAQVLLCVKGAFGIAEDCNEQGIMNFLADRIDQHQKWQWQIASSLGASVRELDALLENALAISEEVTEFDA
jgi:starvation-inducible DNA-binding protein